MYKHDEKYKSFWESKDLEELKGKIVNPKMWDIEIDEYLGLIGSTSTLGKDVLDIGCGIGRLMKPLSYSAKSILGLDISPDMKREGDIYLEGCPNAEIRLVKDDYSWPVEMSSIDYCYSVIVFQHIPTLEIIRRYVYEMRLALRVGGTFRIQTHIGKPSPTANFHGYHGHYFESAEDFAREFRHTGLQVDKTEVGLGHKDWIWITGQRV